MANTTFEECLRKTVQIEIERIVKEGIHEVEERLKRETPMIISKLAISIMQRVSIYHNGRDICIRAEWDPKDR